MYEQQSTRPIQQPLELYRELGINTVVEEGLNSVQIGGKIQTYNSGVTAANPISNTKDDG